MKYRFILKVLLIAMAIAAVSCGRSRNGRPEASPPSVNVMTDTIRLTSAAIPVITTGLLSTETEMKLSFKSGGLIGSFPVREGESVKKGELIASLDLTEISSAVNQYRLALEKAERDLSRAENLYADSVATLEMLQNARTARDLARASLTAATFNRDRAVITATTSGKVLKKLAERGEVTGAGHPVVLFAPDDGEWVMVSGVSDKNIVKITEGDSAKVTLDAFPGKSFRGVVRETGAFADPWTGTYTVKTTVIEPVPAFRTGMTGKIKIYPPPMENTIIIPLRVLTDTGDGAAYIYLVANGSWKKQRIITGEMTGEGIVVRSGLEPGDIFITEGMSYLAPGVTLNIINR
jgi:RND family efflux transporter MFP subunit